MAPPVRAVRIHRFGSPDVLELNDIPIPSPAENEVLVRVTAAGVGPWDALIREGKSALVQSLPTTLGSDLAGTLEQNGPFEATFRVGEEVFGSTAGFVGAYAEFAVVPSGMLAAKPNHCSAVEAASVPIVAVTAWQMLDRAGPVRGCTVLVLGGAGSVGAFAMQMARERGARLIAGVSPGDAAYARLVGADDTVDVSASGLSEIGSPVDVVLDMIGGDVQTASLAVIKTGGSLVSVVGPPDEARCRQLGIRGSFFYVDVNAADLTRIARALDAGKLRANVGTTLPLADARRAHDMMAGSVPRARGKIVLRVDR